MEKFLKVLIKILNVSIVSMVLCFWGYSEMAVEGRILTESYFNELKIQVSKGI